MTRVELPLRRFSLNFTVAFQGEKYDVSTSFYPGGQIGDTFIDRKKDKVAAKLGMQLDAACRDSAILLSLALQHGCSIERLKHSVTRDEDGLTPSSLLGQIIDTISVIQDEAQVSP